jgi:hypothetical protein
LFLTLIVEGECLNELIFLIRHAPFWGVPILILSLEFGYIFWKRKKRKSFKVAIILGVFSVLFLSWYVYWGSPEKAVKQFLYFYYDTIKKSR